MGLEMGAASVLKKEEKLKKKISFWGSKFPKNLEKREKNCKLQKNR